MKADFLEEKGFHGVLGREENKGRDFKSAGRDPVWSLGKSVFQQWTLAGAAGAALASGLIPSWLVHSSDSCPYLNPGSITSS